MNKPIIKSAFIKCLVLCALALVFFSCGKEDYHYKGVPKPYEYGSDEEVEPDPAGLKLMSFNIRYKNSGDKGVQNWDARGPAVIAMLEEEKPVLMGVQECLSDQKNYILKKCSRYGAIGVGRDDGKNSGEMMLIFYDKNAVSIVDWGTFWLSETPDVPSKSWDSACKRSATWARIRINATGKELFYTNTHLDHVYDYTRSEQMKVLEVMMKELNTAGLPMALTADFNTDQNSSIFNGISEFMYNARKSSPMTDSKGTYNAFGSRTGSIIDNIFYSKTGLKSLRYRTVTTAFAGISYISDHYPIYAILEFQ